MAAPLTALNRRELHAIHSAVPQPILSIWLGYTTWGLSKESLNPSTFITWWGGIFFSGSVPPDSMMNSESVVNIKASDPGVVIGYQVGTFTHTWSAESFIA